jgi:hypothetical protein
MLVSIVPGVLAVLVLAFGAVEVTGSDDGVEMKRLPFREMDARFKYFLFVVVLCTLGNSSDAFILLRGQERGLSMLR